jgi:hypothetical protein
LDTELEPFSLGGPRIKDLGANVRERERCLVAITNSLCVKCVRVSQLLNTAESQARLQLVFRQAEADEPGREAVLALKKGNPEYGTRRIRDVLKRLETLPISETEVRRMLHEAKLLETPAKTSRPEPGPGASSGQSRTNAGSRSAPGSTPSDGYAYDDPPARPPGHIAKCAGAKPRILRK